jgi:hypothetical protein
LQFEVNFRNSLRSSKSVFPYILDFERFIIMNDSSALTIELAK